MSGEAGEMSRRGFLKRAAASAALPAAGKLAEEAEKPAASDEPPGNTARLPQRPYGHTGVKLSLVALGGIVVRGAEQGHANRTVARAVERGVNYFDVAPSYGDAEQRLGPSLEPYRKHCFLACKTQKRDAAGAREELKRSLEHLRTDYLDLYQLHALSDVQKDVDVVFAKGGAMEVFLEANKAGQVRHLGFSAHSEAAALAAMDRYDFDSVLFPINFATFYQGGFGPKVIARAKDKGLALLALKALARQSWPKGHADRKKYRKCWYQPLSDRREAELGLRFTLSQPVTAAVPPGEEELFWLAVDLAMQHRPISEAETRELQAVARTLEPIFRAQSGPSGPSSR